MKVERTRSTSDGWETYEIEGDLEEVLAVLDLLEIAEEEWTLEDIHKKKPSGCVFD